MQEISPTVAARLQNKHVTGTDKQAIAASFGKAAKHYDQSAAFQRQVGHQLLDTLPSLPQGSHWLDVGCGTGYFTRQLQAMRYRTTAVDLSELMLAQAKARCDGTGTFCVADAESLPFPDNHFDAAFSSLALQWCSDLAVPLRELQRVVKPGGVIGMTTLAEGSLFELERAWQSVDTQLHVNQFDSVTQLSQAVADAGLNAAELSVQPVVMHYARALDLMKDLKGIGATHLSEPRRQGLFSRTALNLIEQSYARFRDSTGQLPATYQVGFGVFTNV
ncbi:MULTISPECIES: malonyl-ACP O-methyltransferase BioC [Photobacterium]|uniref:malonyl-ACP O-methyltransferase BioC n=1 Tax=Photobacterium TaxID=657 RepID=UPI000619C557|nr:MULTISPECIES: malonyl-ACP O-methyltransferase BioC [Photobacterium]UIP29075.1 malonyl-ACP O-methyltransferase BioC [Photobacterium sp. TLY01]